MEWQPRIEFALYPNGIFIMRKPARIAAALAFSGVLFSLTAHASTISVQGQATSGATTNAYGPLIGSGLVTGETVVGTLNNWVNGAQAYSWGNDAGAYGAAAWGYTDFNAQAGFQNLFTVSNDSASVQSYSLDFLVNGGGLYTANADRFRSPGSYSFSSYTLTISKNAVELFRSHAALDASGQLTTAGVAFDSPNGLQSDYWNHGYLWNDTNLNLDLGLLSPGEEMAILVSLNLVATGHDAANESCHIESLCAPYASAFFQDPGAISADTLPNAPTLIRSGNVNAVPEPATASLFLLGLIGIAAGRRGICR
jgi:hypothetical protein